VGAADSTLDKTHISSFLDMNEQIQLYMKEHVHLNAKKSNIFGENKVKTFPCLDGPLVLQVKFHKFLI